MEQTLISRKELAGRWGVTTRTIINYEENGIITRNLKFDKPYYYVKEIEEIDQYKPNPLSHMERKKLEHENKELRDKINVLESVLMKVVNVGTESMNILTNINL
jgi:hypothetical protein